MEATLGVGFAIIAFVPAVVGILSSLILQIWAPFAVGLIVAVFAPVLAFLWLAFAPNEAREKTDVVGVSKQLA